MKLKFITKYEQNETSGPIFQIVITKSEQKLKGH